MGMMLNAGNQESSIQVPKNNSDFLQKLRGQIGKDEGYWTCSYKQDPKYADSMLWKGRIHKDLSDIPEDQGSNNYFAVSTVHVDVNGGFRRRKSQFGEMFVLVLDDIGSKGDHPPLQATYWLETSPGNYQVGYKLAVPVTDVGVAERLLKNLCQKRGVADREGNNPVRYMRLPYGSNTKAKFQPAFMHVLKEWHPELNYTVEEICDAFGLDIQDVLYGKASSSSAIHQGIEALGSLPEHLVHTSTTTSASVVSLVRSAPFYLPTPVNQGIVKEMLSTYPPDQGPGKSSDRNKWLYSIWAVASLGWGQIGEQIAREWSQTGALYDERKFDSDYYSFDQREGGITILSLYRYARDAGYTGSSLQMQDQVNAFSAIIPANSGTGSAPPKYGDILNGNLFVQRYRGRFKYVFEKSQWMYWNQQRWAWCNAGQEMEAAKETAQHYMRVAASRLSSDARNPDFKQDVTHAIKTHDQKRLQAMLTMAASNPDMGIPRMADLDADPMLLGVRNGVVDLERGVLVPADPAQLITRQCDASFVPEACCPVWLSFLGTCFPNDPDMILYLQKAIGYTLTGKVSEEVLHFCYGSGRNGKSVMANVLYRIFGDYGMVMRTESLMRSRHNEGGQSNDIARLSGARLVLANETRVEQALDDARLKELVSTETISARFLHREFFDFTPTHKIWVRGNHKPRIADTSDGAWRRIRLVPFDVQIDPSNVDPKLEQKLLAERDGILTWAVAGCLQWQREGLNPARKVMAASSEYRTENDILGLWIADECTLGGQHQEDQQWMYQNWKFWCDQNGHLAGSKNTFTRRLTDRTGIGVAKPGGRPVYTGLKLQGKQFGGQLP